MRAALLVLALAGSARADDDLQLRTLQSFPGVDLVESHQEITHTHGGPPADLDRAYVNFVTHDDKPHVVVAKRLELLHGHCKAKDWSSRKRLAVTGYEVFTWDDANPVASAKDRAVLPVKAKRYQVKLAFAVEKVYQACDRFAFALALDVDGKQATVELPLSVIREEPLRH